MTTRLLLGASVAWGALATAAAADVTPEEVWAGWQTAMESIYGGYTAASEEMNGDTLVITDLRVSTDFPEGTMSFTVPSIELKDNGDGTVTVTTANEYDGMVSIEEDGQTMDMDLYVRQIGASMIVSGSPEDLTSTYSAESVSVGLDELKADGQTIPNALVDITLNGMSGTSNLQETSTEQAYQVENIHMDVSMKNPDTDDTVKLDALLNAVEVTSKSEGNMAAMADLHQMASEGGTFSFDGGIAGTDITVSGVAEGSPFAVALASGAGSVSSGLSDAGLVYDSLTKDVTATIEVNAFPQPIELAIAEYGTNATIPVLPSEEPAPAAIGVALRDFTMSDALWDIFDPAKILPRIPATIALGLEGDAIIREALFDPAQSEKIAEMFEEGNPPVTLDNLRLSELEVTAAGAMITGTGDLTFDNEDLETFNGFPRPEGEVSLRAVGLNGLLDNLGQMGILPAEQLMGPRMMLSMFTVVEAQDTLTSTIEFLSGGQIKANGQRIR